MSEREFIAWIRGRLGRRNGRILVDSGHDAAVVRIGRQSVLFKTDAVIEGVHFTRRATPEQIGHKAIARCLSDIAAMGCLPTFAVVAMAVPRSARMADLQRIFEGMNRTASEFKVAIVGGDVASHAGKLAITVSMLGEARGVKPLRRDGARVGDRILVTGPLGGSIRGKHLTFMPRVREGYDLNRKFEIHAMTDISDGLLVDLSHICEESGVGALLVEEWIPVSRSSTLKGALGDGEDYELLFTAPIDEAEKIRRAGRATVIGEISPLDGMHLLKPGGIVNKLEARGWEHRFA